LSCSNIPFPALRPDLNVDVIKGILSLAIIVYMGYESRQVSSHRNCRFHISFFQHGCGHIMKHYAVRLIPFLLPTMGLFSSPPTRPMRDAPNRRRPGRRPLPVTLKESVCALMRIHDRIKPPSRILTLRNIWKSAPRACGIRARERAGGRRVEAITQPDQTKNTI
jgi:hypothetical protein